MEKDATLIFAYVASLVDADGDTIAGASVTLAQRQIPVVTLGLGAMDVPVGIDEVPTLRN